MRLKLLLPQVEPDVFHEPAIYPYLQCGGRRFHLRQELRKTVRDTVYVAVTARRYDCLRCGRTFRVYPLGVTDDQVSRRLKGLAVLFYIMGFGCGTVSQMLAALGYPMGKTAVYNAVQAGGSRVAGLRREAARLWTAGPAPSAPGASVTQVKCNDEWLTAGVTTDAITGTTLTIDLPDNGEATALRGWLRKVAEAVHASVLLEIGATPAQAPADNDELMSTL